MADIVGSVLSVTIDGKLIPLGTVTKSRQIARGKDTLTITLQVRPDWVGLWKVRAAK